MVIHRVFRSTSIPALAFAALVYLMTTLQAAAVTLLRDPDIEHGLTQISAPILRAAGLNPNRVKVLVVNDSSLNAFVINGRAIFLHSGLIQRVDSAAMLQAVIAHEAAHIANGHIARRTQNLKGAQTIAGLGLALAAIAAASGAGADAAAGLAIGTSSSAFRSFLKHTRAEESSADQSALRYMRAAGVDPRGMIRVHELFRGQETLAERRQDPYMRSHPLSRDRVRAAKAYVSGTGAAPAPNTNAEYWFARAKGKLGAFQRAPSWTKRRAGSSGFADIKQMRLAVAHHRNSDSKKALKAMNAALSARPRDAFYHELKGQILLENRRLGEAVQSYKTAVSLAPNNALTLGGYGRALLAAGQPKAAISVLEKSRARDFRDARVMRDLAVAYAKTGQPGQAALASAERFALQGRLNDAGRMAKRAMGQLPRGSAAWRRAQDVLIAYERTAKRRK